jgi:hypothetical protein
LKAPRQPFACLHPTPPKKKKESPKKNLANHLLHAVCSRMNVEQHAVLVDCEDNDSKGKT